jgi:DNA-directed RNA polymerase beta subunit
MFISAQTSLVIAGCHCRDDVPIVVVLKAMGVESDQEAVALVGPEPGLAAMMIPSLEQAATLQWASGGTGVFTQQQALEWLGGCRLQPTCPQAGSRVIGHSCRKYTAQLT